MILQDCSIQRLKNNFTLISESPILWATKTSSSLFRNFKFRTQQKRSIIGNKIFELPRVENLVTVFAIVVLWTIAIMAYCTSERIVRLLDVIWDGWQVVVGLNILLLTQTQAWIDQLASLFKGSVSRQIFNVSSTCCPLLLLCFKKYQE